MPSEISRLGTHIKARRIALGLHQREVAEILGTSPFTVLGWERRGRNPARRLMSRVIAFLGYDPTRPPPSGQDA